MDKMRGATLTRLMSNGSVWVKKNVLFQSIFDSVLSMIDRGNHPLGAIKTRWMWARAGAFKGLGVCSCVALKGSIMNKVSCQVYEKRPETCRVAVMPGDAACIDIREMLAEMLKQFKEM